MNGRDSQMKEEEMQHRPDSPPLGLLDPSRIQNPLAEAHHNSDAFVMPEQPRQQQHWQRTPTMSPATNFVATGFDGGNTPNSQRSSTGTPQHAGQHTPQHPPFIHGSPAQPTTPNAGPSFEYQMQYNPNMHQMHPQQMIQQYPHPHMHSQQWQQQQQQQMYQRQRVQQRVPVPYPQQYSGNITPGSMPPGYSQPSQGPPRQQAAPNAAPPQPPPQQRPQYPPGYPFPPQNPPQQMTPTGQQYPPNAFNSPMYVRQPNGQQTRQYISPQAAQPTTPHAAARFVHQSSNSPHFAPDIRSPSLISPHQRTEMRPMPIPQTAQPPQPQPPPQPAAQQFQFRPNESFGNMNPELFLTGCVFHIFDAEKLVTDKLDLHNIIFAIKFYGGEVDFSPKTYPEKMQLVTHVIIDSYRSPFARAPLEHRKRLVTLQWLVDVLMKKQMEFPWKLAHLPGPFIDGFRPYTGKLFAIAGFDETERPAIHFMAEAMGAKISPFLARHNDLLIAKNDNNRKVEKAREWGVQIVTYQWLADAYVSASPIPQERPPPDSPRYRLGQQCYEVNQSPNIMELISPDIKNLLSPWKQRIIVTEEHDARAKENRMRLSQDESQFPNIRYLKQAPPPTDEELAAAHARNNEQMREYETYLEKKKNGEEVAEEKKPPLKVVVCFGTGFSENVLNTLSKKVLYLGGKICTDVKECTHLVLINGRRSVKLLEGICLGKNIVAPEWIIDGYKNGSFMDTLDYYLRDEEIEKQLGYSCKRSILRARHRPIFDDVEFYVTKSVQPDRKTIRNLIELAGGKVHDEKPTPQYIAKCVEVEQPFIIVSCDVDARTLSYLSECNFPCYNVDLVLMSILRQNIELHPIYRVAVPVRSSHVKPANRIVPQPVPAN